MTYYRKHILFCRKLISALLVVTLGLSMIVVPATPAGALPLTVGRAMSLRSFQPPVLRGMTVHPENPLLFDFIVDRGQGQLSNDLLKAESEKLIKYFLASITIPDKDAWVNLSPYEKDRIIPEALGQTEMGRQMLEQDYVLKQISASLTNPDEDLGQKFWNEVKARAQKQFGTTEIPLNTFNKVWIVPDAATVVEKDGFVYITESTLKVMLDEDYVALANQTAKAESFATAKDVVLNDVNKLSTAVFRELILPHLVKEVNEGKNFAPTRQVYQSVILASWYKKALKDSLLGRIYADKSKIEGVESDVRDIKQKVYDQYLEALKKGAYNVIKEEGADAIPRKYFSGGLQWAPDVKVDRSSSAITMALARIKKLGSRIALITANTIEAGRGSRYLADKGTNAQFVDAKLGGEIKLAEDLSLEEFELRWTAYLRSQDEIFPDFAQDEQRYKPLLDLFTPEVKQALLDDPSLKPVFLQLLPKKSVGELVLNEDFANENIGGKPILEFLQAHRSFLIGNTQVALEALVNKPETKIIIGITDRYSAADETLLPDFRVANGRQAYFIDGDWVGVKGSGQYIDPNKAPHYYEQAVNPDLSKHWGLASEKEAQRAMAAAGLLNNSQGLFVKTLGYQYLTELPDGKGNLVPVKSLNLRSPDGSEFIPVLIYNRGFYPQRLVKFPQILRGDPGLESLRRKMSKMMVKLKMLPEGEVLSAKEIFLNGMKKRGIAEAEKQNALRFQLSIHAQDILFPSYEEGDREESLPFDYFSTEVEIGTATEYDREILRLYKISTAGILSTINDFGNIIAHTPRDQREVIFPVPTQAIEAFFQGYFSSLDKKYMEIWATKESVSGKMRPLPMKNWGIWAWDSVIPTVIQQHEIKLGFKEKRELTQQNFSLVLQWAQAELSKRNLPASLRESATSSASSGVGTLKRITLAIAAVGLTAAVVIPPAVDDGFIEKVKLEIQQIVAPRMSNQDQFISTFKFYYDVEELRKKLNQLDQSVLREPSLAHVTSLLALVKETQRLRQKTVDHGQASEASDDDLMGIIYGAMYVSINSLKIHMKSIDQEFKKTMGENLPRAVAMARKGYFKNAALTRELKDELEKLPKEQMAKPAGQKLALAMSRYESFRNDIFERFELQRVVMEHNKTLDRMEKLLVQAVDDANNLQIGRARETLAAVESEFAQKIKQYEVAFKRTPTGTVLDTRRQQPMALKDFMGPLQDMEARIQEAKEIIEFFELEFDFRTLAKSPSWDAASRKFLKEIFEKVEIKIINLSIRNPKLTENYQDLKRRIKQRLNDRTTPSSLNDGQRAQVGGIDFDPSKLNLQIKRDGQGVPLPLSQQDIEHIDIKGLYPVIIHIMPVNAQTLPILRQSRRTEPNGNGPANG